MSALSKIIIVAGKPLLNNMNSSSIAHLKATSSELKHLVSMRDHRDADNDSNAVARAIDAFIVDDLPRLKNAWIGIPRDEWQSLVESSAKHGATKCIAWMFQQIKNIHVVAGNRHGGKEWYTKKEEDLAIEALKNLTDDEHAVITIINSGVFEYTGATHAMFFAEAMPSVLKRLAYLTNSLTYDARGQRATSNADIGCVILNLLTNDATTQLAKDIIDICSPFIDDDGLIDGILGNYFDFDDMNGFVNFCERACNVVPDWLIIKCCVAIVIREFDFKAIAGKVVMKRMFALDKEKLPANINMYRMAYNIIESENDPMSHVKFSYDEGVMVLDFY